MQVVAEIDFSRPMALFPLSRCVLLPHATAPLHIFEPRYLRMTADALDGNGLIAMATFAGDLWQSQYQGEPPIRPAVCLGYILRDERLSDRRYDLLLHGLCRAEVAKEVPHKPYRKAVLRPLEPERPMEIDLVETRRRVEEMLRDPLLENLAQVSALRNLLTRAIPTPVLVDVAAAALCGDPEQQYSLLAEPDVDQRAGWLVGHLQSLRKTLHLAKRLCPPPSDDEVSWN